MKIKRGRLQQIIREELTRVLSEADIDGDGELSADELRGLADKLDDGMIDVVSRDTGEVLRAPASVVADFMRISSDDPRLAGDDPGVELDADEFDDLQVRMEPKRRSPEDLYAELQFNARGAQSEMGSDDLRDGAQAILDGSFSAEEQRSLINHLFEPGADEETLINHTTILMQEPEG
jgi:hypothetical protein